MALSSLDGVTGAAKPYHLNSWWRHSTDVRAPYIPTILTLIDVGDGCRSKRKLEVKRVLRQYVASHNVYVT
jgi:hypothetical protein